MQRVLLNAVRWAAPVKRVRDPHDFIPKQLGWLGHGSELPTGIKNPFPGSFDHGKNRQPWAGVVQNFPKMVAGSKSPTGKIRTGHVVVTPYPVQNFQSSAEFDQIAFLTSSARPMMLDMSAIANQGKWIVPSCALAMLFAGGCAAGAKSTSASAKLVPPPASQPATSRVATPELPPMTQPFLIREAKLPKGFPPPGPAGQVLIKNYPGYRAACVQSSSLNRAGANAMFYPLFNHIQKHDIPMTAPVEMRYTAASQDSTAQPVAMAFLYADPGLGQTGADGIVQVDDIPPITVLSIGVRGSYNTTGFQKGLQQLNAWLDAHPGQYTVSGPPRFLAYNSPFVPWLLKFGEVQIPVTPVASSK